MLYSIFEPKPSQGCKHGSMASSIENKQDWIKHVREVIQERTIHLRGALKEPIHIPKSATAKHHKGHRRYRDGEDLDSQGDGSSQPDTISIASRTSQNTLDSDKVSTHTLVISLAIPISYTAYSICDHEEKASVEKNLRTLML
ncbi:unnamed protein product [Oncorhynchus mykiss]|uniref:PH domain-containing protein n=2 Tax=Oncorhynchus TaxID=8016 RepID=A0A060Z7C2_ONCMY|nr:unnamed protein product [Oncorhynchus mykiss]